MVVYGPSLEKRQLLLARFVDAGAELFAMSATLARVQAMIGRSDPEATSAVDLADYFCRSSQLRIGESFRAHPTKIATIPATSSRKNYLPDFPKVCLTEFSRNR